MTSGMQARSEWRAHWPLVLASAAGFSLHTISSYVIGLVMEPLQAEFGWARAQISVVSVIPAIIMVLLSPSIGGLVDRFGSRRLAIPSLVLTGIALALVSLANGSLAQWYLLWLFYGLVSLGIKATIWTTAISNAFTAARGLALGVVLCGTAVSQIAAPPLAQWLTDEYGWRQAYLWLGLGWAAPCVLLAVFFLYDSRDRVRLSMDRRQEGPDKGIALSGLTLRQALRDVPLIRIGVSTLITMFIGTAILIHQVPILTSVGVSRGDAAWLASLSGAAAIAGKLLTGWMADRWNAGLIGALTLLTPVAAYLMLIQPQHLAWWYVIAMMIIGYTTGAKLQICAYLTARYAGMAHFGKIFGVMTSLVGIGGGLGSVVAGGIYDYAGSYVPLLWAGVFTSVLCSALIFRLGPYPNWTRAASEIKPT
ncbi:putative MFS family arabinose efflux permease [Novosphingobium chloroacetimidivorans]|uniref:Putative MFS family arabinose efflux permease n=1 Tax=Novosphingobium chloroacetimidivorans TaxID=1428314 RepID=A0A7W7K8V9_9SPHN|nr:MFS transporter [Novosphingobium chloroacetimidivorans]MBB4858356.1 putative MFS family arabinose efflux permease [Novosphingobium chloroacetimidivorans]